MHRSRCNTALSMAIAVCSTYATDRSRDAMTVTSPLILGPNARAARPDGAALQFLFEELPPQHLADQGLRQLRAELHLLGHFELRQPLPAILQDFRRGRRLALLQHNEGLDLLAPQVLGNADDAGLFDLRVRAEALIHFAGIDVQAARLDHILLAVENEEKPVLVHPDHVARREPAATQHRRRPERPREFRSPDPPPAPRCRAAAARCTGCDAGRRPGCNASRDRLR